MTADRPLADRLDSRYLLTFCTHGRQGQTSSTVAARSGPLNTGTLANLADRAAVADQKPSSRHFERDSLAIAHEVPIHVRQQYSRDLNIAIGTE